MGERKAIRKGLVYLIVLALVAMIFATVPMNVSGEGTVDPSVPLEEHESWFDEENGWLVEGNGTYFEISNSSYLNITLTSSEMVYVYLESIPRIVSYHIQAYDTATSTQITLSGFVVSKTYYRYQDGYLQEEFTTDGTGSYSYTQDLTEHHHVYVQEETSTLFISSDYTFTEDIYDNIVVTADNIVIDGNGYTLQGSGSGYGIYLAYRSGITIKNLEIKGFTNGIYIQYSNYNTISYNTISDNTEAGIYMWYYLISFEIYNTISYNTISNSYLGILVFALTWTPPIYIHNTISYNTITNSDYGICLNYDSYYTTISYNTISHNDYGIYIYVGQQNTISYNTISDNTEAGIYIPGWSHFNTISYNTITNSYYGIYLVYVNSKNTVSHNTISNCNYGIYMHEHCYSNTISYNTIFNNNYGIYIWDRYIWDPYGIISYNTITNNNYGIYIKQGRGLPIYSNTISNNNYGIYIEYCSGHIHYNTISNNNNGIYIEHGNWLTIDHNNIIANLIQAYDLNPEVTRWHHLGLLEGNYWSDYTGVDDGSGTEKHAIPGDWIGDTKIPHPYENYDFYPFTTGIGNLPPVIDSITGPLDPVAVGTSFTMTGEFTDPNVDDTHTATWTWAEGETSDGDVNQLEDTVSGEHVYTTPGVYQISLTIVDFFGLSDTATWTQYIVIYDPNGAFITGGGMIDSPEGAFPADPTATGKATFGFVSKYKKGSTTPDGNTQFKFHAGDLGFKSTSYDWLVVSGARGQFKGTGTINGEGEFGFMLTAIDGDLPGGGGVDKFRIKIWDKETDELIYDNNVGDEDDNSDPETELMHGSIKIHKA
ncbi:MAG: right-handed parallel beta-helix repeat-containing protein [Methanomassiliicoccales archaeon]|nr:MAG: right-handed parallel beta-helix repeat-containing protein [Methanomassiliicoccales archaeon]